MAGRSPRSQATMMVGIRVKGTWAGALHMRVYWAKIDIIINIITKTTLILILRIIICIIILSIILVKILRGMNTRYK